ncbi:D-2-hydroxyacid dehydrogenase [Paraburkholderia caribensis]|uniref:D-2-hydroxyacid dehydrogenase n=1 Tax=Paraburkholderia caribensis TaxID=75105 RepID=UPI000561CE5B|nr:D-2-hydroxyacid dehydrogenase [Paraburkholderia caribensis]
MNIVFLDRDTIPQQTCLRRGSFPHAWIDYGATDPRQVAERIRDADIVVTNKVPVTAAALDDAPRVKLIAIAATGTNVVDIGVCTARDIVVSNIRDYAVHTVPEHTFALIFALRRSLIAYRESVRAGRWEESGQFCYFDHPIRDLAGSTLGVIGDGALGRAVARLGEALGMHVLLAAHKGRAGMGSLYTSFDTVLRTSDVITLHCPLNSQTRDLIDTREFELMERNPLLINTARGGLVNERAVGRALAEGRISGAGFDVATSEPLGVDHPFHALLKFPNFILTPHVAWASEQAVQALADQLIDNIEAFVRGTPRNVVNS